MGNTKKTKKKVEEVENEISCEDVGPVAGEGVVGKVPNYPGFAEEGEGYGFGVPEPFGGHGFGYGTGGFGLAELANRDYWGFPRQQIDDETIGKGLRQIINNDQRIVPADKESIQIYVDDGVVTLEGTVKRRYSELAAFTNAFWHQGVIDVVNNLKVVSRA
jgi:hypothetical protein